VIHCFRNWDKFSKTRQVEFRDYIEGWEVKARLPHRATCVKLLMLIQHLLTSRLYKLLSLLKQYLGSPFCGMLDDIWSKRLCKQSFACMRLPLAIDGDLLDGFIASLVSTERHATKYAGTVISCSPILSFSTLPSSRHTGHVIARWKRERLAATNVLTLKDISLATEDGASNNKKSNKLLGIPSKVCTPHNLQRAVLLASGLTGTPCRNPPLKKFCGKSSKMVGAFSKSSVAQAGLVESQQNDDEWDKSWSLSAPNHTRWLGLHRQATKNRNLQPNISEALCGDPAGKDDHLDDEVDAGDLSESGSGRSGTESEKAVSSDDELVESQVRSGKDYPLEHRLLTKDEFDLNAQFESVLASPAETSAILQVHDGTRLEEAYDCLQVIVEQAEAPRVQVVSGRGAAESWAEVPATRLDPMFKDFRSIFASECNTRFKLKGTPDEHVLLALKMNPFIDTSKDGDFGHAATQSLMDAIYRTAARAPNAHACAKGQGDNLCCDYDDSGH